MAAGVGWAGEGITADVLVGRDAVTGAVLERRVRSDEALSGQAGVDVAVAFCA